ncbi:hypothetical protein TIFTF001_034199 [Ficus carica]|uniref:Secreted protein n=1 Tax=Ficus carica TaxID=3494 RepID=A0AA88J8I9_FICCA|nr:hypothetical protein TIFTF001_034199 [Ficus carica]
MFSPSLSSFFSLLFSHTILALLRCGFVAVEKMTVEATARVLATSWEFVHGPVCATSGRFVNPSSYYTPEYEVKDSDILAAFRAPEETTRYPEPVIYSLQ